MSAPVTITRSKATSKGAEAIFLFIAELHGFKFGTKAEKIEAGQDHYISNDLLDLNLDSEKDRKDLHENIWLERLYAELDTYYQLKLSGIFKSRVISGAMTKQELFANPSNSHKWTLPIEIDMSASVLGYVGLLIGHKPFMDRCNMTDDYLTDAWHSDKIKNRKQFKMIMRTIYGSSQKCYEMWQDEGIPYTLEDIEAYNKELLDGELAVADRFSKFIITNVKPNAEMTVKIWKDEFKIECNRYRNIGEETIKYELYDSQKGLQTIFHTETTKVPDLHSFRRYFVTLLIHNLDSQVMNRVLKVLVSEGYFSIDIHDAIVIDPEGASRARELYANELTELYNNRKEILSQYFSSIGIGASAQAEWENVKKAVVPFEGEFKCSPMVLK